MVGPGFDSHLRLILDITLISCQIGESNGPYTHGSVCALSFVVGQIKLMNFRRLSYCVC